MAGTTNVTPLNVRTLDFEANRGQAASQALFLAHGNQSTLFLTSDGVVVGLSAKGIATSPVQMSFAGARARKIESQHELPGKVNYLIGNDRAKWQTDVPTYGRVQYKNVYRGVDLAYYGNQRQLEYDFVVAPGADLAFKAVDDVKGEWIPLGRGSASRGPGSATAASSRVVS